MHLKMIDVFDEVQENTSCHQKFLQIMQNLFTSASFEEFSDEFKRILDILFQQALGQKVENINRCFSFSAKFCSNLAKQHDKHRESESDDNYETHPLIVNLIKEIITYHNLADERGRYYSCQFISVLLREIGNDGNLESHLYETIQDAMLARITDIKVSVRLQAVSALLRLQDPSYSNCPVMKAFIQGLGDPSPSVRRAIVQNIAVCKMSMSHIIARLLDVDHMVRLAAFSKCAMIGPKFMKIADRQAVMMNGISEINKSVRKMFVENLLPKWLFAYDHSYIKFMNALRLDADENDIKQTVYIYEKYLDILFKSEPLKDLVEALALDDNKLISQENVSIENVFYWSYLVNFFETKVKGDTDIAPELSSLCEFIERLIQEKSSKKLSDWEYLEYQQILFRLFQMAERANLADEVGRQLLHKLIIKTMNAIKLEANVLSQLVIILQKFLPDVEKLSNEICMIISEIMEPLDERANEEPLRDQNFKEAEIRAKLNILKHEQDEAVKKSDYLAAANIQKEVELLKIKSKELQDQIEAANKVTLPQESPEMIARALDILIALLQILHVQTIPINLRSCMNEFVTPLIINTNACLHWRTFKCIVLFALMSKEVALENLKFICSPIIIYRLMSTYDKSTLLISVSAVSDLLRMYGKSLFNTGDANDLENGNVTKPTRRLYKLSLSTDLETFDFNSITCEDLIDIFLDMLDDDFQEIRETAAIAITRLVYAEIMVSSSLLSRLFLKWFNPVTEKYDQKIQQLLGASIVHFCKQAKGSAEILEETIIPTLCIIGNAPRTSPLSEVNVDAMLNFMAALTKMRNEFSEIHHNLAYSILSKIQHKNNEQYVLLLANMLLRLDEPHHNKVAIDELSMKIENCLKVVNDKATVKALIKYKKNLTGQTFDINTTIVGSSGTRYSSLINTSVANAKNDEIFSTEPQETSHCLKSTEKRSKQARRTNRTTSLTTVADEHIEVENNFEQDCVFIETPTSESRSSSESVWPHTSNQIVPETSSDSGDSIMNLRRSKRKIMKRN